MIEKQKVTVKEMSKAVVEAKSVKYVPAKHIHAAHIQLTFEFERGELLSNLTLLEDHAQEFQCPYCMEKHLSKVIGYAEEIAEGREGDEKIMEALADETHALGWHILLHLNKSIELVELEPRSTLVV